MYAYVSMCVFCMLQVFLILSFHIGLFDLLFQEEVARIKSLPGALKIAGMTLSLAGATTMSLHKGHGMLMKHHFIHIQ